MNNVAFFEVQASEPERAIQFYAHVFGWQFIRQEEMSIDYWQIVSGGINGGLLARPAPAPQTGAGTNAFVCSIQVDDFDKTAAAIMQHGGAVALPKFAVPGKCWQGYFLDTDHNTFGLFQVDPDAR